MMGFAAPAFLVFAALAVVVLVLHAYRRARIEVPSLMLWRRFALAAGARRSRRRWPPLTWPLVLQVAAVVLAALALAQPFAGPRPAPGHLVVVLDGSGAMAAGAEGGGTLFDAARARLLAETGGADAVGPETVSLILAAPVPRLVAAGRAFRPDLMPGLLPDLAVSEGPADWPRVARMAKSLGAGGEGTDLLFVSARAVPDELATLSPDLLTVGGSVARGDLTAEVTALDAAAGRWRVAGEVRFSGGLDAGVVTLGYSDAPGVVPLPWADIPVSAGAEGRAGFRREIALPGPGVLTVAFDGREAARFVLGQVRDETRVLYLGAGGQPLLPALSAGQNVALFQADSLPGDLSGYDLVVADGVSLPAVPDAPTIWIGAAHVAGQPVPQPYAEADPVSWTQGHALGRGVDWSSLTLTRAYARPAMDGAAQIVAAQDHPLVQLRAGGGPAQLWLGFDPADSNWPDRPELAVLAGLMLDWFGLPSAGGQEQEVACTVGRPCGAALAGLESLGEDARPLDHFGELPERAGLFGRQGGAPYLAVNPAADSAAPLSGAGDEGRVLPRGWARWLLVAAGLCVAFDTFLAARRKSGFRVPQPLALLALALLVAGVLRLPLPVPVPSETLVLVQSGRGEARAGGLFGPDLAVVETGGIVRLGQTGPSADTAATRPLVQAGEALDLAAARIPEGRDGRLVLAGDAMVRPTPAEIDALFGREGAGRRIVVDRLPAAPLSGAELVLRLVDAAPTVLAGDPVRVTALVDAGQDGETGLSVLRDGEEIARRTVTLRAGANRIETLLPPQPEGEGLIEIALDAGPGDDPANNRAGHILTAAPLRPVAVVGPDADHTTAFVTLLADEGIEARAMMPSQMPNYPRGWLGHGGVVLLNSPAIAMSRRQQDMLKEAVRDHGLGLLILGGENSFGPGGYLETPLEDLSPLSARVPRDAPAVDMVFVLDRSGSMQQKVGAATRLDVAKHATLSAAELLNPESRIGVVVFDAEARVVLPLSTLDLAGTEVALGRIDTGGGTSIYPGLVRAWEMLRDSEAPARHVIVMTDGLSQPGDWPGILGRMRAAGITVSAVATGRGSDRDSVETIAALGGGTAHITSDFEALPSILSQEAMMFASPVEEGARQPLWEDSAAPFFAGLPDPMPPVEGFVLTTPKPQARIGMTVPDSEDEQMPLIAWWRVGTGQVLAFSSDATGPWSARWHDLPGYGGLWAGALRSFQTALPQSGWHLAGESDGQSLHIALSALDEDGAPETGLAPVAELHGPAGEAMRLRLTEARPGLYQAATPLGVPGRYEMRVMHGDAPVAAAYHHSYPSELTYGATSGTAVWLAEISGGGLTSLADALAEGAGLTIEWARHWRIWVVLALAVFMTALVRRYAEGAMVLRSRRKGRVT